MVDINKNLFLNKNGFNETMLYKKRKKKKREGKHGENFIV